MSFTKVGDCGGLLSVIKTQSGKEEKLTKCAKCGGWHAKTDKCPMEEEIDERPAKN